MSHLAFELVQGHICQFRMTTHTENKDGKRGLVKKPRGFLSSSRCVRQEHNKKCTGDHAHVPLVGGRAAGAQVYPQMLCEAICRGLARQQQEDAAMGASTRRMSADEVRSFAHYICDLNEARRSGILKIDSITEIEDSITPIGLYPEHWVDTRHELEGGDDRFGSRAQCGVTLLKVEVNGPSYKNGYETVWDDVTNENLIPELLHAARAVEMEYLNKLGVYEKFS